MKIVLHINNVLNVSTSSLYCFYVIFYAILMIWVNFHFLYRLYPS